MKLPNAFFFMPGQKRGDHHPPVRSIHDLALEFKITSMQLVGLLREDSAAPKSTFTGHQKGHATPMYNLAEMQKWWKARQQKQEIADAE